jgi:hypothetical protein
MTTPEAVAALAGPAGRKLVEVDRLTGHSREVPVTGEVVALMARCTGWDVPTVVGVLLDGHDVATVAYVRRLRF